MPHTRSLTARGMVLIPGGFDWRVREIFIPCSVATGPGYDLHSMRNVFAFGSSHERLFNSFLSRLSCENLGNCMSVPVVGACLCSAACPCHI